MVKSNRKGRHSQSRTALRETCEDFRNGYALRSNVQHSVSLTTSGSAQQQPTQTQSALHLRLSLYVQCSALQCTSAVALGEDEHPQEFSEEDVRSA